MSEIKVSVVIPVYNVEKYLHECMDSVINQTLQEIEIICVDDGSTDNSLSILQEYAKNDDRITVLQQKNQGAGVARNAGLEIAKGEYLSFLDPDDFFEFNMLEETYEKAIETDVDIVVFGYHVYNETTKEFIVKSGTRVDGVAKNCFPVDTTFSYKDINNDLFSCMGYAAWNKLYKKTFVQSHSLIFQPLFRSNDKFFTCIALILAKKIAFLDKVLLYYRRGMSTNSQATNHCYPLHFYMCELAICDKLKILEVYEKLELSFLNAMLSSAIYNMNSQKTLDGFAAVYNHISKNLDNDFNIKSQEIYFENSQNYKLYKEYILISTNSLEDYLKNKGLNFDEDSTPIKVSVIIPVYNVEKYLVECLDSVINQTLTEIEIICINDGSSDNSIDILKEYAFKDKRIRVFNQRNQGLSITRNKGIYLAKGKYLYFLDSDDKIKLYALETLYNFSLKNTLDVLCFDAESIFDNSNLEFKHKNYSNLYKANFRVYSVITGDEIFCKFVDSNSYRTQSSLQFINSDYLKKINIKFQEGILHEDNLFTFQLILLSKRTHHLNERLFIRRVRENSIMTSQKKFENFYGYFKCYQNMLNFSNINHFNDKTYQCINKVLNNILYNSTKDYMSLGDYERKKINTLNVLEMHSFNSLILPNLSNNNLTPQKNKNINSRSDVGNIKLQDDIKLLKKEVNKYKGQVNYHVNSKQLIKKSVSYKAGRFITFIPRLIRSLLNPR